LVKMIERLGQQPPRPNSGTVDGGIPQRSVDIDRTLLAGRVLRLGEAEAAMVARISRHLEKRPWATGFALTAIEHYVQIRYMLEATGTWDAALGETPMP